MTSRTRRSRRRFLAAAAGLLAAGVARGATLDDEGARQLRLLKVRHSTFVVEIDRVRALVDPCFSRGLGFGPLLGAPSPSLEAARVGRHELLLVTSGRADHLDARALRLLGGRPWCFVPDEGTAKALRDAGHRRVRVVEPGDVVTAAGVEVRVSPSQDGLFGAPAVGYRLARAGRSVWHTGSPPPLDVLPDPVGFARAHASEVVIACWDKLTTIGGREITMSALDGQILAALARARLVITAHDAAEPTLLGGLLIAREAGPKERSLPGGPRVIVVEPGVWYRVG